MESFSSDSGSQRDPTRASLKLSRLQADYDDLLAENARLKSQFEQLFPLQNQWERLQSENRRLLSQLTVLTSERDDLSNRLDLSLQSIRELNARLDDEKRTAESQRSALAKAHSDELARVRALDKAQLESPASNLDGPQKGLEQERVELKLRGHAIAHLLETAER
jgi:peptidoglycan hydrolase CwlO-like protein